MRPADVVIVGAGLMGAGVAARIRAQDPTARIVLLDAGPPIGSRPFQHLHDSVEADVREEYLVRASPGIQALYTGPELGPSLGGTTVGAKPGMYDLTAFGVDAAQMSGAAQGWNAGGMGAHWTAATPTPWGAELFDDLSNDLTIARELLKVHPDPFGRNGIGDRLSAVLVEHFADVSAPGRNVQPMPMAVAPATPGVDGPLARTGPNVIFPRLLEPSGRDVEILTETLALRLEHDGKSARGVRVRRHGEEFVVEGRTVVVAADVLRTPQLLFASGIRPEALGTHLNEHAFLTGQVLTDLPRLGLDLADVPHPRDGEWVIGSYWLPHSGSAQPFHGQIMDRLYVDEQGEHLAHSTGMSWYVPTEVRAQNRVEFSETETDASGMPRPRLVFDYSETDLAMIEAARSSQQRAAERLGEFDPERDSALLAPGSSLHYTGTARSGVEDDGTNVCDPDGRVRGFGNLFLAGGAVVPTAIVGNSTLVAMVTAVRAARAVGRTLSQ